MKHFIILFVLVLSAKSFGQPPTFDDLKILYADGNYEKLVVQSEKYTLKEVLKKDPVPYMWLAKGLDKIASSGTTDEKFKNAYKDAVNALSKSLKNDKDSSCYREHKEFVDGFQAGLVERINNELAANDYKKAAGWDVKYYKVSFNILGAKYLDGACKFMTGDRGSANTLWAACEKELKLIKSVENWSKADLDILRIGIIKTAECYITARQTDKAKALLDKVAPWFENDPEFKEKYNELTK